MFVVTYKLIVYDIFHNDILIIKLLLHPRDNVWNHHVSYVVNLQQSFFELDIFRYIFFRSLMTLFKSLFFYDIFLLQFTDLHLEFQY